MSNTCGVKRNFHDLHEGAGYIIYNMKNMKSQNNTYTRSTTQFSQPEEVKQALALTQN